MIRLKFVERKESNKKERKNETFLDRRLRRRNTNSSKLHVGRKKKRKIK